MSEITGSILSDTTLLDAIRICKRETTANDATLSETKLMKSNLLQKLSELYDVINLGTAIHQAILQMSVIQKEFYYWTGSTLLAIFNKVLKKKGKSNTNLSSGLSLKSRAVEISQSILEESLQLFKCTMFSDDYVLLSSALSLKTLIHLDQVSADEVTSFLSCTYSCDGNSSSSSEYNAFDFNSSRDHIVESAKSLEKKHPAFLGLTESLYLKQTLWIEYLTSPPELLANVPCDHLSHLNIGQKALLWKALRPDLIKEIMSQLSCNVLLGQLSTKPYDCSVSNILTEVERNVPVVFLTPTDGVMSHPTLEIRHEAKRHDIHLIEKSAPFLPDLDRFFEISMKNGYWLILHECDLEENWPKAVVSMIHSLCDEQLSFSAADVAQMDFKQDTDTQSSSSNISFAGSDQSISKRPCMFIDETSKDPFIIHNDFRLWLIMKPNGTFLPEILLRKALIVNLDGPLKHNGQMMHHSDIATVREKGTSLTHSAKMVEFKLEEPLKTTLSLLHCLVLDANLIDNYKLCHYFVHRVHMDGILHLCEVLLPWNEYCERNSESLEKIINEIFSENKHVAIQSKVDECLKSHISKMKNRTARKDHWHEKSAMHTKIAKISKWTSSFSCAEQHFEMNNMLLSCKETAFEELIMNMQKRIENLYMPEMSSKIKHGKGPLADFFCSEHTRAMTLLHLLQSELFNCIAAVKGQHEVTAALSETIDALLAQRIPQNWLQQHPEIFCVMKHSTVHAVILKLESLLFCFSRYSEGIVDCVDGNHFQSGVTRSSVMQTPIHYNLAAFLRPDLFLKAVLSHSTQSTSSAEESFFEMEIFQKNRPGVISSTVMSSSIIIDGILLCNALYESKSQTITDCSSNLLCKLPAIHLMPKVVSNSSEKSDVVYCPLRTGERTDDLILLYIPLKCIDPTSFHLGNVRAFPSLE